MTALMVANDGGHLMQLVTLAPRLPVEDDRLWLTVPTPQTESLLEGRRVHWMSPARTRDAAAVMRNAARALSLLRRTEVSAVVSTGASLALSVLPAARLRGVPCFYVESATRVHGPSVSGRVLARVPGVRLFTQHEGWADSRWSFRGSVLDGYEGVATDASGEAPVRRVVVSLGTSESYGFRRLLDRLVDVLPPGAEVLWQTGSTDTNGLGIAARPRVPAHELFAAMADADVVIAHAGTGSALAALQAGRIPVLVPRRPEHDEHVDDHQLQIAQMLATRGLAVVREAEVLDLGALRQAAGLQATTRDAVPVLRLTD